MSEVKIQNIEDLTGVGPAIAEKFREAGYSTLEEIGTQSPGQLSDATGIGQESCAKYIKEAGKNAKIGSFLTGTELMEKRATVGKLTTSSSTFDELLGGGVETQSITEFYGQYGSGKTQFMLQLAVNAQLPVEQGGLGGEVAIIDTENTFRPERIISMAKALELDPDEVLSKIHVGRAYNSHQQMLMVKKVKEIAKEKPIKMLAVDSLTGAFRAEYIGRGTLAERQGKINAHMSALARFGDLHNAAVVVTNQVSSNPAAFFGDPTKPIGGNIVGHTSKFRIYLRRGKAGRRVCRLVDSPHLPENEALVSITEDGIRDG
ncbi:MAG: DNA repair and recombination protein RadA [Candidatus Poseidoniia archaeon]|jgi:DNA repair protein RadA|uniref:DNA repair and recombination protein RadA n=1 Tax=marine metagenome TaxID=408172 RepID=A0A381YV22_9ZZZZ|nr:DNA repair and recombination protein RadA [Candidatus Poseidoniia archaeon]MDP6185566.1 DNA repair and recombination protein RadA [Candidatus Poseidoniia archaeon]MDP7096515.1 DNA repair and recombination protein RadA [Candidatus Poseidoniia archaeon]HJM81703.1 DNA repair and recombination protein RadA [Candidatus Poseidoniia archaeon]|tara:strand:- start:630 stop:1583 length:954 start_codon:yes stop_codon:yes gene_type:complete